MFAPLLVHKDSLSNSGGDGSYSLSYSKARGESYYRDKCPFCQVNCVIFEDEMHIWDAEDHNLLAVCWQCGWWSYEHDQIIDLSGNSSYMSARSVLREFSIASVDAPLQELSRYIERHHDSLQRISPIKFEELIGSVFSETLGYRVETCSYGQHDKGIDLICVRTDHNDTVAIQAKRYRHPIKLGVVHQFLGALGMAQIKHGVLVTSSQFQKGCYEEVANSPEILGIEVDLVDGQRFLEFLEIANTKTDKIYCPYWRQVGYASNWSSPNDRWIPMNIVKTQLVQQGDKG